MKVAFESSRRQFLASMTGACLTAAVAPTSVAAGRLIDVSDDLWLGFSLYGMKTLTLEAAIRACAEIGYSEVELCLNAGYPTDPSVFSLDQRKAAAKLLQSVNVKASCLMVLLSLTADAQSHQKNLKLIAAAGELAHQLSPDSPPILETILGGSPAKWDEQKGGMLSQLKDWASAAETAAVVIAIKAHVSSSVNSPERLMWLLDRVESTAIQVAFDYSHFQLQGMDLEQSLKPLLTRTRFIHVKDTSGDASKFQFLLPGQGHTDYVGYFRLLRKHQYRGPVCVEVSGQVFSKPEYSPIPAAKQCFEVLSKALMDSRSG